MDILFTWFVEHFGGVFVPMDVVVVYLVYQNHVRSVENAQLQGKIDTLLEVVSGRGN